MPLGEESESYVVRVLSGGSVLREEVVSAPLWQYPAAQRVADGTTASFTLRVAQVSATYGAGAFAEIEVSP